jgi:rhamnosyltransferase
VTPDVSILLLTRNGIATLPGVLDAIAKQQASFRFETVAVDSGSTDGTVALLGQRVNRLIEIPAITFNHGLTRNAGIEECRGAFVVLLVQDAVPQSAQWLDHLVAPLAHDETLAGSFARQVPRKDASAVTRHYAERWLAASPTPRVSSITSPRAFEALPPMDRFTTCVFDNVCSCVRRSIWDRYRFNRTPIAEDLEWAKAVLLAGYRLAYVPEAVVVHSHDRSARYELMRTYLVHQRLRALFGVATIPDLARLVRAISTTVPLHLRCAMTGSSSRAAGELVRALALALAWPIGQYLGARSTDTGRDYLQPAGL